MKMHNKQLIDSCNSSKYSDDSSIPLIIDSQSKSFIKWNHKSVAKGIITLNDLVFNTQFNTVI